MYSNSHCEANIYLYIIINILEVVKMAYTIAKSTGYTGNQRTTMFTVKFLLQLMVMLYV